MCGRYSILDDIDELCERFACPIPGFTVQPRYNAAPTQYLPIVVSGDTGNELRIMRWGLIPHWAKEAKIGSRLINARIETLAEKPAFRAALRYRRCLVPADGYYEWFPGEKGKVPHRVIGKDAKVFAFAGLWEKWSDPEGDEIQSFTIVTTEPVPNLAWLHNRMPLILPDHLEKTWLQGMQDFSPKTMVAFLHQMRPVDELQAFPVSTRVNSPRNDDPSVMQPA